MIVNSFPDRTISYEGKEYLYFGGTAYLGLPTNKEFQEILVQSLLTWGTAYGSSRNANIKLSIYETFEKYFSEYVEAESTLAVSSGTLAGKLVVEYLSKKNNLFFHYPNSHPAILASNSKPLFENEELNTDLTNNVEEDIVIVLDAILSSEVTSTSLEFLDSISTKKTITLVVDESHSIGLVGNNGEGLFNTVKTKHICRKIMISSLSKALGLSLGIIASDADFIEQLKAEASFVSASAANPAYLEVFIKSKQLCLEQRKKLRKNLLYLSQKLIPKGSIKFNSNYPVLYVSNQEVYEALLKENIIIARFKYPTYKAYMNRIVITANHQINDLDKLIKVLNTYA
jgi:8-amino-7-oxononanoate synthase